MKDFLSSTDWTLDVCESDCEFGTRTSAFMAAVPRPGAGEVMQSGRRLDTRQASTIMSSPGCMCTQFSQYSFCDLQRTLTMQ